MNMFRNWIGGAWTDGADAGQDINPSDLADPVGDFAIANGRQVDDAFAAARAAFPRWAASTAQVRADVLAAIAAELFACRSQLGTLLAREEGKLLAEATGEVVRASQSFSYFAAEALRLRGDLLPAVRPGVEIEISREPVGVIGVITPWNFPIAIPAWKIAPALAFGNCVVFKPSEITPAMGWALTDIASRCGVPAGVLNLVMGGGDVGAAIVDRADAVTFTGSGMTGRRIAARAIERMIPVQLEMGGKNPLVVLDDADLDQAVEIALNGAFFQTGQRCTASSRLIVTPAVHDAFVHKLQQRLATLTVGPALDPESGMGPVVSERQLESNLAYVALGRSEGARCIGGERIECRTRGFYMRPALMLEATNDMRISREEIFGPVASVIAVADYEEALALANDTPFGLSAGICTRSLKYARHFQRNAVAGLTMVNLPTAGADYHAPFGGRKASSFGPREQGSVAADFFTCLKTSYVAASL